MYVLVSFCHASILESGPHWFSVSVSQHLNSTCKYNTFPAWKFSSDTMCRLPLWCLHGEMNTFNPIREHWVCSQCLHVQCGNPTRSQSLSKDFLILTHFIIRKDQGNYTHVHEGNNQSWTQPFTLLTLRFWLLPVSEAPFWFCFCLA